MEYLDDVMFIHEEEYDDLLTVLHNREKLWCFTMKIDIIKQGVLSEGGQGTLRTIHSQVDQVLIHENAASAV